MGAFLVDAVHATLNWNDLFFGGAVGFIINALRTAWTLLSAFLSLFVAVATLCLNAAVEFVTLIPQILSLAVRFLAATVFTILRAFSLFKDAFSAAKAFCHSFALLCLDVLNQIETLLADARLALQWTSDALQTCLECTAECFLDLAALVTHLRRSFYLLVRAAVDRLFSLLLVVLLLPFRLLASVPIPIYLVVIGAPLSYRLTRLIWAWMRTQNCVTSTPLFRAVDAAKTVIESRCWGPAKQLLLVTADFVYSKVVTPVKLLTLIASQVMVDQVYVPFLRDLTMLARHCFRLYVEFLFLLCAFSLSSTRRVFLLLYGSLIFVLDALFRYVLVSGWRVCLRQMGRLSEAFRRGIREIILRGGSVKTKALACFRALLAKLSSVRTRIHSELIALRGFFWRGGDVDEAAVRDGRAGTGNVSSAVAQSTAHSSSCSVSSSSSSSSRPSTSARAASTGEEATVKALRRELTEAEERQRCVVCLVAFKSMLVLPCRHACLCRPCAVEIINHADVNQRLCPLCRTLMHEVLHVYM